MTTRTFDDDELERLGPPELDEKERMILGLLVERGECYGLDLVEASGGKLLRGVVYVKLADMVDRELVTSRFGDDPGTFVSRRLYSATAFGRKALEVSR